MTWKRLEGSGVSLDLTSGLEARIADPLWLLARQWQTGEFAGEDAASPVAIEAEIDWHPVGELKLGSRRPLKVDPAAGPPLEARVEGEPVRTGPARLRVAAEAALQLLRLARTTSADKNLLGRLQKTYPLVLPADDGLDAKGRLELRLLARGAFDGLALAHALASGTAPDPAIASIAGAWLAATLSNTVEPDADGPEAWDSERMEYRFALAAPRFSDGTRLESREYPGGHLDWPAFDMAAKQSAVLVETSKQTARVDTIPVPLRYAGMPAPRWWSFEDGAVYWGDIQGGPADLARYLVAAFATVYGDDWFLVPVEIPCGSLAQVASVSVSDTFGRRFSISAAAALDHDRVGDARSFRMFELTGDLAPEGGHAPRLLLPASLPTHEEGEPREEILLLRDEAANLAWAVERVIESPAGRRVFRRAEHRPGTPDNDPAPGAWVYDLSTAVPGHYVPLVAVRIEGSAAIRLQRGRMATTTGTSGARGLLLEPSRRLLLHDEEVPSSGVRVTRAYQFARSPDGTAHLWCGRRKSPGARLHGPGLTHDVVRTGGAREK